MPLHGHFKLRRSRRRRRRCNSRARSPRQRIVSTARNHSGGFTAGPPVCFAAAAVPSATAVPQQQQQGDCSVSPNRAFSFGPLSLNRTGGDIGNGNGNGVAVLLHQHQQQQQLPPIATCMCVCVCFSPLFRRLELAPPTSPAAPTPPPLFSAAFSIPPLALSGVFHSIPSGLVGLATHQSARGGGGGTAVAFSSLKI